MAQTSVLSVFSFALAALLGAAGGWTTYLFNLRWWAGVVCYLLVMGLFVAALKRGGALTVLYPVYASTFIWAAMIAWWADGTPIWRSTLPA